MTEVTRWHLLRHAPTAVAKGTIYGRTDVPASEQEASILAPIAERLPAGAVLVTTPLRRTSDTARMLGASGWTGDIGIVEPAFREQDFGAWEGTTHAALAESGAAGYAAFWDDPAGNRPPGGESFADLLKRAGDAFETLTERYRGRDIVLVGHGGSIRACLARALDLAPERALGLDVAPLSLSLADHVAGDGPLPPWRLRALNLTFGT